MSNLVLVLHDNHSIYIGKDIEIFVAKTELNSVTLSISAPRSMEIKRKTDKRIVERPKKLFRLGRDE